MSGEHILANGFCDLYEFKHFNLVTPIRYLFAPSRYMSNNLDLRCITDGTFVLGCGVVDFPDPKCLSNYTRMLSFDSFYGEIHGKWSIYFFFGLINKIAFNVIRLHLSNQFGSRRLIAFCQKLHKIHCWVKSRTSLRVFLLLSLGEI